MDDALYPTWLRGASEVPRWYAPEEEAHACR